VPVRDLFFSPIPNKPTVLARGRTWGGGELRVGIVLCEKLLATGRNSFMWEIVRDLDMTHRANNFSPENLFYSFMWLLSRLRWDHTFLCGLVDSAKFHSQRNSFVWYNVCAYYTHMLNLWTWTITEKMKERRSNHLWVDTPTSRNSGMTTRSGFL
jgi:hypothetical protein